MKQKIVAMLLGTAMIVSTLVGCGNQEVSESTIAESKSEAVESSSGEEGASEPIKEVITTEHGTIPVDQFAGTELTIAISKSAGDTTEDFNEKPIMKLMEEATGIHINWEIIDVSVRQERVSTLLASGDLPDAFLNGLILGTEMAANEGMFYDLSEEGLLETYCPDVLDDYINGGQNVLETITWPDGSIYGLAGNVGNSYSTDPQGIWYINKVWLDNVGMDIPTTDEEFYEVLCAFRDQDANGNGDASDEIPLSFCNNKWAACFANFANSWGIAARRDGDKYHYYMLKDGVVEPTVDTQAWREFLEYYHKLAEEGLLDIEGFSQTAEQYVTKQAENRVGILIDWTPPVELQDQYVPMKPFSVDGYKTVKTGSQNYPYFCVGGLVAAADCSNIEALLHWWNYMASTTDLKYTANYGEKGLTWDIDENGKYVTLNAITAEIDYPLQQTLGGNASPYQTPAEVHDVPGYRQDAVDFLWDMTLTEYINAEKVVAPEAIQERKLIEADLVDYIGGFTATSVVDGLTDASWEQFLKDLETYGYYDYIEWWQKFVDGELD